MPSEDKIEEFKIWVDCIPDFLYYFFKDNPDLEEPLNFTPESLIFLGNYLIENITLDELKINKGLHERLAMYVGEMFVRNIEDGYWDIEYKKNYIYNGIPVIRKTTKKGFENCPHYAVLAAINRKDGSLLKRLFDKMKEVK